MNAKPKIVLSESDAERLERLLDSLPDAAFPGKDELMAEIEMDDTVTDESALDHWKPMSEVGDLLIYVPTGMVPQAKELCKRHGIKPMGIRTWRFVPVWGLQVAEA